MQFRAHFLRRFQDHSNCVVSSIFQFLNISRINAQLLKLFHGVIRDVLISLHLRCINLQSRNHILPLTLYCFLTE